MKTGLINSNTFQNHDTGPGHPEQIARVAVIIENFKKFINTNSDNIKDFDTLINNHKNNTLKLLINKAFEISLKNIRRFKSKKN